MFGSFFAGIIALACGGIAKSLWKNRKNPEAKKKEAESRTRVAGIISKYLDIMKSGSTSPLNGIIKAGLGDVQTDDEARNVVKRWVELGLGMDIQEYGWIADHPEPLKVVKELCAVGAMNHSDIVMKCGPKGTATLEPECHENPFFK